MCFFMYHFRFKIYNLQFQSDEVQQRITVEGPQISNWFAVAFVTWTDPNNDRIEQQGKANSEHLNSFKNTSVLFKQFHINLFCLHIYNIS